MPAQFPPIPPPWSMPFYYASLSSLTLYWKVPVRLLAPYLRGTGLRPAPFLWGGVPDYDSGVVSIEFQTYTGHGGTILETVAEVEFNILAYPEVWSQRLADMSLTEYLTGRDQTKIIGGMRIFVPADNHFAVQAGQEIFGEPKFLTYFVYSVPALNNPSVRSWSYSVLDPATPLPPFGTPVPVPGSIYSIEASFDGCAAIPANPSALTLWSMWPNASIPGRQGYHEGRLIGSYWNIFDVSTVHELTAAQAANVKVTPGDSRHPMGEGVRELITTPAVAARVFQSKPAAVENHAFFVEA